MSPSFFVVGIVVGPTATTTPATSVLATSATLNGVVSDGLQSQQGGGSSSYHFDYGTDPNFGAFSSTTSSSFSGMGVPSPPTCPA